MRNQITNKALLLLYSFLWLFIGAVSSLDVVYTVALHEHLYQNEENPIARFILHSDNWQVARFTGLKMYCTIIVLGFLLWIYHKNLKIALIIASIISFLQFCLLLYLLLQTTEQANIWLKKNKIKYYLLSRFFMMMILKHT